MKHLTAQPAVDELPAPFPNVIRKALAKDPKDRYQTVNEMMAEVFAVSDLTQSVNAIDSLSLTRMAAAVARKLRAEAPVPVGGGSGSSNVTAWASPPPVPRPGSGGTIGWSNVRRDVAPWMTADRVPPSAPEADAPFPPRSRWVTGLLGLCFGWAGVHRFYLGYNLIGVFQFIVMFTGIGALWGMIEGLIILANGQFRDALGRPLVQGWFVPKGHPSSPGADAPRKSKPVATADPRAPAARTSRRLLARMGWGFAAFLMLGGAIATGCVATFARTEMSEGLNGGYHWNSMHGLYFATSVFAPLALFALWKLLHRAELSFWKATVRPAILCLLLTVIGAALNFELNLAAGQLQLLGVVAAALAMVSFCFFWLLRGPELVAAAGDAYWSRAWARFFLMIFIASCVGGSICMGRWSRLKFQLETGLPEYSDVVIEEYDWSEWRRIGQGFAYDFEREFHAALQAGTEAESEDSGSDQPARAAAEAARRSLRKQVLVEGSPPAPQPVGREYRVANLQYTQWPLALLFCVVTAIGSMGEMRYRKRVALRADELATQAA